MIATGLRRTMDRLLRQSDFAGLKGKVRPVKTPPSRSSVSYDASEVNSPVRKVRLLVFLGICLQHL